MLEVFQSMAEAEDTVLFIEHNSTLVATADAVGELGLEGGCSGVIDYTNVNIVYYGQRR